MHESVNSYPSERVPSWPRMAPQAHNQLPASPVLPSSTQPQDWLQSNQTDIIPPVTFQKNTYAMPSDQYTPQSGGYSTYGYSLIREIANIITRRRLEEDAAYWRNTPQDLGSLKQKYDCAKSRTVEMTREFLQNMQGNVWPDLHEILNSASSLDPDSQLTRLKNAVRDMTFVQSLMHCLLKLLPAETNTDGVHTASTAYSPVDQYETIHSGPLANGISPDSRRNGNSLEKAPGNTTARNTDSRQNHLYNVNILPRTDSRVLHSSTEPSSTERTSNSFTETEFAWDSSPSLISATMDTEQMGSQSLDRNDISRGDEEIRRSDSANYDFEQDNHTNDMAGIEGRPVIQWTSINRPKTAPMWVPCPIKSCLRNKCTPPKLFARADNLGGHLRKVHGVEVPRRHRVRDWVTGKDSLRPLQEAEQKTREWIKLGILDDDGRLHSLG